MKKEMLSLSDSAKYLLDEARLVLPGIQSMFGFQLIVIFTEAFNKLEPAQRLIHLVALSLMAIAIVIIMTPAAIHRERGSREVREDFINVSSWLLLLSMFPLAVGLCLDFYLVVSVTLDVQWAASAAAILFAVFVFFWVVLPKSQLLQEAARPPK
jgi:hypothetical protein